MSEAPDRLALEFVRFAVEAGVLRFGEIKTKAGRQAPYFFNAGRFDDGAKLAALAQFYARRLATSGIECDLVFGPAYKGIVLAATLAVELSRDGRAMPYAYNRKEAKDHGEGGTLVGAALKGRVLIVDDVISAGTSVRESIGLIRAGGGIPQAVLLALDRQERTGDGGDDAKGSAVQQVKRAGLQVAAVATLADLLGYLQSADDPALASHAGAVRAYRERYGV